MPGIINIDDLRLNRTIFRLRYHFQVETEPRKKVERRNEGALPPEFFNFSQNASRACQLRLFVAIRAALLFD